MRGNQSVKNIMCYSSVFPLSWPVAHLNSRGKLQLIEDKGHQVSAANVPSGHKSPSIVQNTHLQGQGGHLGEHTNGLNNIQIFIPSTEHAVSVFLMCSIWRNRGMFGVLLDLRFVSVSCLTSAPPRLHPVPQM